MTRAIRETLRAMGEQRRTYLAVDIGRSGIAYIALDDDELYVTDCGTIRQVLATEGLQVPDGVEAIVGEWGFQWQDGLGEEKWIIRHLALDTAAQPLVDDLEAAIAAVLARARRVSTRAERTA